MPSIHTNHAATVGDLPDAVRDYRPDPAMISRGFVPASAIRKLIREHAPRAEIERLTRLGGQAAK
jgi:hypothetical protein